MHTIELPDKGLMQKMFNEHNDTRMLVVKNLHEKLTLMFQGLSSRPSIKSRVKDFNSFFKKYVKLLKNSASGDKKPFIADLMGIRIICPFIEDLRIVEEILKKNFEIIEIERKGSNCSFKEFGYESTHIIIRIPHDILEKYEDFGADAAEIQIRTILQDAWAEVEHELVYKADFNPFDAPLKRKLAAVNASLSLADTIFQEIRDYQHQLNGQLDKRRGTFYHQVDKFSDDLMLFDEQTAFPAHEDDTIAPPSVLDYPSSGASIDDMLLNALYAHNENDFSAAVKIYSQILELDPPDMIKALIFKHRGMAFFAQSKYQEAIDDFSRVLEYDAKAYRAPYYRGIVYSVLQNYAKAIDDFTFSLEMNPYQSFCLFRRAQAYYHANDYPASLSDCENALVLDPSSQPIRKFKDVILNKLKM